MGCRAPITNTTSVSYLRSHISLDASFIDTVERLRGLHNNRSPMVSYIMIKFLAIIIS